MIRNRGFLLGGIAIGLVLGVIFAPNVPRALPWLILLVVIAFLLLLR